ncbi:MAG: tyrosine-type recombinase/integrase [Terriglobales bacterium]
MELVDAETGEIRRRAAAMELGEHRSRAAAEASLDKYLALLESETLSPGARVTFRQYVARFDRLQIALLAVESQRHHRHILRSHLLPAFGAHTLADVDAGAVQELIAALHRRGLARATIEAVRNRLLQLLHHARAAGFAAHVIRRREITLPADPRPQRERRHIAPAELERILEVEPLPRRALWAVMGLAGLRIAEALGLTWQHVDLSPGVLHVRQAAVAGQIGALKTKSSSRDVPLLPQLAAILTEMRATQPGTATELLFATRRGTPLRSDDIRSRWLKPLLDRLQLPTAGCHAFRHGLPGRLDALGLSPASIQKIMGHSSLAMTERYLHRSDADLRTQLASALERSGERAVIASQHSQVFGFCDQTASQSLHLSASENCPDTDQVAVQGTQGRHLGWNPRLRRQVR